MKSVMGHLPRNSEFIHGYLKYMDRNDKTKVYNIGVNWVIFKRQSVHFHVLLLMDKSEFSKDLAIKEDR